MKTGVGREARDYLAFNGMFDKGSRVGLAETPISERALGGIFMDMISAAYDAMIKKLYVSVNKLNTSR